MLRGELHTLFVVLCFCIRKVSTAPVPIAQINCQCSCEGKSGEQGCVGIGAGNQGPYGAHSCKCDGVTEWCMNLIGINTNYDYRACARTLRQGGGISDVISPPPFSDLIQKAQSTGGAMTCQSGVPDDVFKNAMKLWNQGPYKLCVCHKDGCNNKPFTEIMQIPIYQPGFHQNDVPIPQPTFPPSVGGGGSGTGVAGGGGGGTGGSGSGDGTGGSGTSSDSSGNATADADKAGKGNTTANPSDKKASGSNTPIIIGVVIGLLVLLAAVAGYFVWKKRQGDAEDEEGGEGGEGGEEGEETEEGPEEVEEEEEE